MLTVLALWYYDEMKYGTVDVGYGIWQLAERTLCHLESSVVRGLEWSGPFLEG